MWQDVDRLAQEIHVFQSKWQVNNLKGVKDKVSSCEQISPDKLTCLIKHHALAQLVRLCPITKTVSESALPVEIEDVLHQYEACFATTHGLPPHRPFDHRINLMPGVQPVKVKPYCYSSQQKDKI
jgi:hypothetical protein